MKRLLLPFISFFQTPSRGGVAGLWENDKDLLKAIHRFREEGFKDFEAITPFPLHEVEEAMKISRSIIPYVAFVFGTVGCLFGLWFTWWTSAVDWPVNVGGKPMWSLPAFFPVIFELVILFSALSSVGALFVICGLPRLNPPIIDPHLSSHQFALFIPEGKRKARNLDMRKKKGSFFMGTGLGGGEENKKSDFTETESDFTERVENIFKQMGAIKIVRTRF